MNKKFFIYVLGLNLFIVSWASSNAINCSNFYLLLKLGGGYEKI